MNDQINATTDWLHAVPWGRWMEQSVDISACDRGLVSVEKHFAFTAICWKVEGLQPICAMFKWFLILLNCSSHFSTIVWFCEASILNLYFMLNKIMPLLLLYAFYILFACSLRCILLPVVAHGKKIMKEANIFRET